MTLRRLPFVAALLFTGCGPAVLPAHVPAGPATSETRLQTRPIPVPDRRLGMNLGGIADWSSEWPFVDAFKTSRPWLEQGDGPFTYDDRGNPLLRPGQSVETFLYRDIDGHYPAGDYVATFDGTGEVEIMNGDVAAVLENQPGRIRFRVRRPTDAGLSIKITLSSPRNPVRNLRIVMPGLESSRDVIHPLYRERLQPFRVVRFMDWQRTNNSPLFTWLQRPRPGDVRYSTESGVPPEAMIDLANACKADPWFCVPHQADDEFVRELAKLVKARLDPALKVYLEYSNEVWNWGFEQAAYAAERGQKLKLGEPANLRYYARRAVEIFDRFDEGFGDRQRVVRVLAGQFASPWASEAVLTWQDAYQKADAFAVGAYFGYDFGAPDKAAATTRLSLEALLERCRAEIEGPYCELVRQHATTAKKYRLQLLAYEGGQHLVGHGGAENNDALTNLFHAANRHPQMYDLYRRQLDVWFAEGGGPFVAFSYAGMPGKFGAWGVLEYQDQPTDQAPKYRALVDTAKGLASP